LLDAVVRRVKLVNVERGEKKKILRIFLTEAEKAC